MIIISQVKKQTIIEVSKLHKNAAIKMNNELVNVFQMCVLIVLGSVQRRGSTRSTLSLQQYIYNGPIAVVSHKALSENSHTDWLRRERCQY